MQPKRGRDSREGRGYFSPVKSLSYCFNTRVHSEEQPSVRFINTDPILRSEMESSWKDESSRFSQTIKLPFMYLRGSEEEAANCVHKSLLFYREKNCFHIHFFCRFAAGLSVCCNKFESNPPIL